MAHMERQQRIETLAGAGSLRELRSMLESNHTQYELDSALTNAIAYSQIKVAEYLLVIGAKMESLDYEGVYFSVYNNQLEGLKFAINRGVDINLHKGTLINTSIETATNTGDCNILKWLLENGASPKLISDQSRDIANKYGTEELKELIKHVC